MLSGNEISEIGGGLLGAVATVEVIFWPWRSSHAAGLQVRGRLVHRRLRDYTCCTSTREAVTFMLTRREMGERAGWMCLVSFA